MEVNLSTERRNILFLDIKNNEIQSNEGGLYFADLSIERLFDGSDDYFGYSGTYIATVTKSEHAWIYTDEHHGKAASTFLDFAELKRLDVSLADKPLYVVPITEFFSSVVLAEVGSGKVESWFRSKDPFMAVFNGLHKYCGNDPQKYIF